MSEKREWVLKAFKGEKKVIVCQLVLASFHHEDEWLRFLKYSYYREEYPRGISALSEKFSQTLSNS